MTEAQGAALIEAVAHLYDGVRVAVVLGALVFGALLFISYKLGRRP